MAHREISRRHFVLRSCTGIGSAWLITNMPEILLAQEHAHQATEAAVPVKFEFFTPDQAAEVEAIAAQIIPTDDTPGAREARVVYFIDRGLTTFASDDRPAFVKGLKELQVKVRKQFPKAKSFAALSSAQQIQLLKAIEKSPFFDLVRTMTVIGMFANPSYGGNYNQIGWKLIGFENKFFFEPPFGFYDGEDQDKK